MGEGGGLNAVLQGEPESGLVPFQPETLDNFEIGAKMIGLDQRVTFNLALFDSKYDDIQRTQLETTVNDDDTISARTLTLNAAKATIRGVETEIQAIPLDGLLINARLSYDFLDDRAQVALWGRNLADETYFQSTLPIAGPLGIIQRGYAPPRLWGAELTYQF